MRIQKAPEECTLNFAPAGNLWLISLHFSIVIFWRFTIWADHYTTVI